MSPGGEQGSLPKRHFEADSAILRQGEVLRQSIAEHMRGIVDQAAWDEATARRDEGRRLLTAVSDDWDNIIEGL